MMSGSGDFDWSGVVGSGLGAVGGLLGGLFSEDTPPAGMTTMNENKRLAMALMKAMMEQKLKLPNAPLLPGQWRGSKTPYSGTGDLAQSQVGAMGAAPATAGYGGGQGKFNPVTGIKPSMAARLAAAIR